MDCVVQTLVYLQTFTPLRNKNKHTNKQNKTKPFESHTQKKLRCFCLVQFEPKWPPLKSIPSDKTRAF